MSCTHNEFKLYANLQIVGEILERQIYQIYEINIWL